MSAQRLRALVVDDEELARRRLRRWIEEEPRIELAGEADSGNSALQQIAALQPDLVFLDVQMPGLDGFEVLRRLERDALPLIVLVTAFDQHAVRAFEVNALDYLLKPVTQERFQQAVERALQRRHQPDDLNQRIMSALAQLQRGDVQARIPLRTSSGVSFLPVDELDWAEVVDDYVRLHAGAETHLLRETMSELEERLPPGKFLRIHRSYLINVERIREIQPWLKGDFALILKDGTRLVSGRTYRERVQQLIR